MALFSVIVPCHNVATTVADSIASVQAQTFADWEMICIDDGSTDATLATLHSIADADHRIRVVHQANAGPSQARNVGAEVAQNAILAFLDADDLWTTGKLASVAGAFETTPRADAVFGRVTFFDGTTGSETARSALRTGALDLESCLGENPVCTSSNLSVRADSFRATGGFDTSLRHAEDLAWLIGTVAAGARIIGTDDDHVRYRASLDGLSSDLDAMHAGWRRAVSSAAGGLSQATLRRAEARHLRYLARRALRIGQCAGTARALALRGLLLAPRTFLGDRYRGPATLIACLAAPLLPAALRRRAFS